MADSLLFCAPTIGRMCVACCRERLFDGVGDELHGLELVRTVATPTVTHLKLAKRQ